MAVPGLLSDHDTQPRALTFIYGTRLRVKTLISWQLYGQIRRQIMQSYELWPGRHN